MSNRRDYSDDYRSMVESETFGATMPPSAVFERSPIQGGAPTVPGAVPAGGVTEPINENTYHKTEPLDTNPSWGATEPVDVLDVNGKQVEPVVGWLVGIKGCCRGQDFRLHSEYNSVGRDSTLDVVLDDKRISNNAAMQVLYDPATKDFMALPGSTNTKRLAYCNGKPLVAPVTLEAYDRLQVGFDGKEFIVELMFVPLCGEHFNWSE